MSQPADVGPDYSRQMLLKEVGAPGQAKLGGSRVLVVGVGGLGSPVVQYLAAAGVGCLGLVDADVLESSNIHRQPIYPAAEIGRLKVELARAAALSINPSIRVETHPMRFTADNAQELVSAYDLAVDCSDNFQTKFMLNDAAVLAQRPAVLASVYQFEGQLQVYRPSPGYACLRCVWPEATADGVVGNCAESGVLGPVPGTLGSLQALMVLKLLLGMRGTLSGELLLLDLSSLSSTKLKAPRRPECRAPSCAHIMSLTVEPKDIELAVGSWEEAQDYSVIDVRSDAEVAVGGARGRHCELSRLLGDPNALPSGGRYLLVCASGQRSLAAARALRARGFDVKSLTGGLRSLEP